MSVAALLTLSFLVVTPQGSGQDLIQGKEPAAWGKALGGTWQHALNALRQLVQHERNKQLRVLTQNQPYVSDAPALMPHLVPSLAQWLRDERTRDTALDLLATWGGDGHGAIPALLEVAGSDAQFRFLRQLSVYVGHGAAIGPRLSEVKRTLENVRVVATTLDAVGFDPTELLAADLERSRDLDFHEEVLATLLACRSERCRELGILKAAEGLDGKGAARAGHGAGGRERLPMPKT